MKRINNINEDDSINSMRKLRNKRIRERILEKNFFFKFYILDCYVHQCILHHVWFVILIHGYLPNSGKYTIYIQFNQQNHDK